MVHTCKIRHIMNSLIYFSANRPNNFTASLGSVCIVDASAVSVSTFSATSEYNTDEEEEEILCCCCNDGDDVKPKMLVGSRRRMVVAFMMYVRRSK